VTTIPNVKGLASLNSNILSLVLTYLSWTMKRIIKNEKIEPGLYRKICDLISSVTVTQESRNILLKVSSLFLIDSTLLIRIMNLFSTGQFPSY
jgi:hypothetical protein